MDIDNVKGRRRSSIKDQETKNALRADESMGDGGWGVVCASSTLTCIVTSLCYKSVSKHLLNIALNLGYNCVFYLFFSL